MFIARGEFPAVHAKLRIHARQQPAFDERLDRSMRFGADSFCYRYALQTKGRLHRSTIRFFLAQDAHDNAHAAFPHKSGRRSDNVIRPFDAAASFLANSGDGLR